MYLKQKKRFRRLVLFSILKLKNFDLEDSILIFSEPRGGSTWLSEIIGSLPQTIINLEPLHVEQGVVPSKFKFGWNPHLKPSNSSKKYEDFFKNVLTFKIFNRWTTGFISVKKIINSRYVVTKFVLANQLLPWMAAHLFHEFKYKPIYLVRHPLTTCISQLKTFHNVEFEDLFTTIPDDEVFEVPQIINNERFVKHKRYVNSLHSRIERQVAFWCLNNANLFHQVYEDKWVTVYYEDLVRDPVTEMNNLTRAAGIPVDQSFWKKINFRKPSSSNFHDNYSNNQTVQLEKVFSTIPIENLGKIQRIFDHFHFSAYSAFEPYPIFLINKF